MGELFVRNGLILVVLLAGPATVSADSHGDTAGQDLPSAEMLEFLGELAPVDDATWRLLEHHANQDLAQNQEVNDE